MIVWTKKADAWTGAEGPFTAKIAPKGDGRFAWAVHADGALHPAASGIAASLGAAKTAAEQLVKRSGRV